MITARLATFVNEIANKYPEANPRDADKASEDHKSYIHNAQRDEWNHPCRRAKGKSEGGPNTSNDEQEFEFGQEVANHAEQTTDNDA